MGHPLSRPLPGSRRRSRAKRARLESVRREIKKGARVFIATVTLCETAWVLRAVYRLNRTQLLSALEALRDDHAFTFEEGALFGEALERCRRGKGDFSDYLIGLDAKVKADVDATLTFDKALRGSQLFRVVE